MSRRNRQPCPDCQRLQAEGTRLQAQVEKLTATVTELREQLARARKDSSTSSKPPSSDIVKPAAAADASQGQRRPGGQPGHEFHERPLVPPDQVKDPVVHRLAGCPTCGHALEVDDTEPRVVQQIEITTVPLIVTEHQSHAGWCPHCQRLHYAPLPPDIERGGWVGPRLATLIVYLKGVCHASYSTIRRYLRDVVGVTWSRGTLAKVIARASQALAEPYAELLAQLPQEERLNVDETGHPQQGERWWTWCFRASLFTLFRIDRRRSAEVLLDVLGQEFDGVLGCDYFGAYRRYMRQCSVTVQFCLAHLIRDVKFLTTLPNRRDRAYGERLREALRSLFRVIHERDRYSPVLFQCLLEHARTQVLQVGLHEVPPTRHSQNLAARLEKHGEEYFTFITTPGLEPTNNLAEQAIRFVVLDRVVTQGTRGPTGQRWCERIWTTIATCVQQGRSLFEYLEAAVRAWYDKEPVPSLLPAAAQA